MSEQFKIEWIDRGGPPTQQPNPDFPNGVNIDLAQGMEPACMVPLPYPTGRNNIGAWLVQCERCGLKVLITAASRPDDPRMAKLPCKGMLQ